jgi:hypothetical protein
MNKHRYVVTTIIMALLNASNNKPILIWYKSINNQVYNLILTVFDINKLHKK